MNNRHTITLDRPVIFGKHATSINLQQTNIIQRSLTQVVSLDTPATTDTQHGVTATRTMHTTLQVYFYMFHSFVTMISWMN